MGCAGPQLPLLPLQAWPVVADQRSSELGLRHPTPQGPQAPRCRPLILPPPLFKSSRARSPLFVLKSSCFGPCVLQLLGRGGRDGRAVGWHGWGGTGLSRSQFCPSAGMRTFYPFPRNLEMETSADSWLPVPEYPVTSLGQVSIHCSGLIGVRSCSRPLGSHSYPNVCKGRLWDLRAEVHSQPPSRADLPHLAAQVWKLRDGQPPGGRGLALLPAWALVSELGVSGLLPPGPEDSQAV